MESRSTLPQSTDIATELTKHQDFDPSTMPSPPQGPLHSDGRPSEEWQDWRDRVRLQAEDEKKEGKALRKIESKMMSQEARAFIQRLFPTNQRAANKKMKGNSSNQKIIALRDQNWEICSDPGYLKQIVQDYFQDLARPMHGSRNALYVPDDVHREYPWEKSNLDPYRITTRVHAEEKGPCILELPKDKSRFLERVRSLARDKAPGKDGLPNENLMNCQKTSSLPPMTSSCSAT